MVKPGFSHFHMEKWHSTIATRIPLTVQTNKEKIKIKNFKLKAIQK